MIGLSFLPVMISRIMLSLRKFAHKQQRDRLPGEPTSVSTGLIEFFRPLRDLTEQDVEGFD